MIQKNKKSLWLLLCKLMLVLHFWGSIPQSASQYRKRTRISRPRGEDDFPLFLDEDIPLLRDEAVPLLRPTVDPYDIEDHIRRREEVVPLIRSTVDPFEIQDIIRSREDVVPLIRPTVDPYEIEDHIRRRQKDRLEAFQDSIRANRKRYQEAIPLLREDDEEKSYDFDYRTTYDRPKRRRNKRKRKGQKSSKAIPRKRKKNNAGTRKSRNNNKKKRSRKIKSQKHEKQSSRKIRRRRKIQNVKFDIPEFNMDEKFKENFDFEIPYSMKEGARLKPFTENRVYHSTLTPFRSSTGLSIKPTSSTLFSVPNTDYRGRRKTRFFNFGTNNIKGGIFPPDVPEVFSTLEEYGKTERAGLLSEEEEKYLRYSNNYPEFDDQGHMKEFVNYDHTEILKPVFVPSKEDPFPNRIPVLERPRTPVLDRPQTSLDIKPTSLILTPSDYALNNDIGTNDDHFEHPLQNEEYLFEVIDENDATNLNKDDNRFLRNTGKHFGRHENEHQFKFAHQEEPKFLGYDVHEGGGRPHFDSHEDDFDPINHNDKHLFTTSKSIDGCISDEDGRYYSPNESWPLKRECGRASCRKNLDGGWEIWEERCESMIENPQYACHIEATIGGEYPLCCPRKLLCRNEI